ncbi:MAG: YMGG-like glycine zipper-containing protein [Candidatus Binatia bacterium]|nr:YMGG-like glycine zipper-containing protein [Candidatus Binatia bacterium]
MHTRTTSSLLVGVLLITVAGCSQPLTTREKGALVGGALGAGTGALIGGGRGAAIGGALGAVGGGLTGDQLQRQETIQAEQQRQIEQQQRELERQRQELERLKRQQEY